MSAESGASQLVSVVALLGAAVVAVLYLLHLIVAGQPFPVLVDYAHTPEAVENAPPGPL